MAGEGCSGLHTAARSKCQALQVVGRLLVGHEGGREAEGPVATSMHTGRCATPLQRLAQRLHWPPVGHPSATHRVCGAAARRGRCRRSCCRRLVLHDRRGGQLAAHDAVDGGEQGEVLRRGEGRTGQGSSSGWQPSCGSPRTSPAGALPSAQRPCPHHQCARPQTCPPTCSQPRRSRIACTSLLVSTPCSFWPPSRRACAARQASRKSME